LAKRGEDAITITTALANTALDIGSEVTLNWDATIGVFDFVNIYLIANGCVIENIANNYQFRNDNESPGEFKWHLTQDLLPGGQGYTIRVEDTQNSELSDEVSPVAIEYQFNRIVYKNIFRSHLFDVFL